MVSLSKCHENLKSPMSACVNEDLYSNLYNQRPGPELGCTVEKKFYIRSYQTQFSG
jgi:hypothetical protein